MWRAGCSRLLRAAWPPLQQAPPLAGIPQQLAPQQQSRSIMKFKSKLGRGYSHRWAMMRNMVTSLIEHERIKTGVAKAKELRRLADRMVTLAKRGDNIAYRRAGQIVKTKEMITKLFTGAPPTRPTPAPPPRLPVPGTRPRLQHSHRTRPSLPAQSLRCGTRTARAATRGC